MSPASRRAPRAVTAIVVASAAAVVGPATLATSGATCAAEGDIRVRVVVDFGDEPGAPRGVSDVCVPVADRDTGAELLAARARQLGTPPPRYEAGMLCAIDGYPATGCFESTGDGYRYWSYWHGESGSWAYANVGPASWRLRDGDVEGWRFLDGGPASSAAPPRTDTASCPAPARPAATTTAPASPRATVAPTPPPAPAATTAPGGPATTTAVPDATTTTADPAPAPRRAENAAARRPAGDGDGGGAPVGLVVAAAAITALAGAAGVRFRRSRDG